MNRLLQYGSVEKIPFYNCTWKSEEEWWQTGQTRPWLGWPLLFFGVCIEVLYIPVIYIIFRTKLIRHGCYKIIVLLAIVDIQATVSSCFITGTFLIQGVVFCVYPTFTYIAGTVSLAYWTTSCACTFFLFINRLINVTLPDLAAQFENKMAYFSIFLCISYFLFFTFFTPTVCYNSVIMAWLPDPLSEEIPSEDASNFYRNHSQAWNNWIFVTSMLIFYTLYFVKVKKIARGQKSKASRAILIQCVIICSFNTGCALVYNALSFITPAPWIIVLGQVCWSVNHGCPAFIYVTMNATIRREFKRLVFRISHKRVEDSTAATSTVAPTRQQ